MMPEGELLTLKGETTEHIFSTHQEVSISYSETPGSLLQLGKALARQDQQNLQMIFVLKGRLQCSLSGAKKKFFTLDDQQHNLLLTHQQLQLSTNNEEHQILFLNIDFSLLSRHLPDDHPGHLKLKAGLANHKPVVFFGQNLYVTPEISTILNTLLSSAHTGFCQKLFLKSKTLELLVLQLLQFELLKAGAPKQQLKKEELDKMHEVREILMTNIGNQLSLRTLAHMVGTNEFNLKRNFKIAFGTTVYNYLNQYKMEQAKTILIEKDISIAELSQKMGYKYATHFSSAFKKYFGYLPNKLKSAKLSLLMVMEDFSLVFENIGMLFG